MSIHVVLEKDIANAEIADAFVGGSEQDQVEILCEMVESIRTWGNAFSWPMQCRYITDRLGDDPRRAEIERMLQDLLDHIQDPPTPTEAE